MEIKKRRHLGVFFSYGIKIITPNTIITQVEPVKMLCNLQNALSKMYCHKWSNSTSMIFSCGCVNKKQLFANFTLTIFIFKCGG